MEALSPGVLFLDKHSPMHYYILGIGMGGKMKIITITLLLGCCIASLQAEVMSITVPAPEVRIEGGELIISGCSFITVPGAPILPSKKVTIALPPGALVESVDFSGLRTALGYCEIIPAHPILPMENDNAISSLFGIYKKQKKNYYTRDDLYPETYGTVLSKGGLRKYTLVDVACYHFGYRPLSSTIYYAPEITLTIRYSMPDAGSKRARFWNGLKNDISYDESAKKLIHNWEDAQRWYATDTPKRANGYYIIIPSNLISSVDTLVAYRQNQGYTVNVITREYIESNIQGDDTQQKIRNYLRNELAQLEYVLLVGVPAVMPWRKMVPFNNLLHSPYNDPDISPIPSDLYYAELTDHDTLSWNADRDSYYGEVYDANMQPNGEDSPDYHADVHLGRIPFDTPADIEAICEKMVAFDMDTDLAYKTSALLAGGMIYYENENYSGYPRLDGSDQMEWLMNDSVIDRNNAVYIYEKAGIRPSPYPCTDSLTNASMMSYWDNKGIVFEYNHGSPDGYWRKYWAWDDGDSIAETGEIQWPLCLYRTDVWQLDNLHPATTFLRSCLNGKPEVSNLASLLLLHGSSSVIAGSRVVWIPLTDPGLSNHFFEKLLQDTSESHGLIGNAYDLARTDYMDAIAFWINTYNFNLYGDPALSQFGRPAAVAELPRQPPRSDFNLYPNPISELVTLQFSTPLVGEIAVNVYDESGRFVRQLFKGHMKEEKKQLLVKLPAGIYFVTLSKGALRETKKIIVIK